MTYSGTAQETNRRYNLPDSIIATLWVGSLALKSMSALTFSEPTRTLLYPDVTDFLRPLSFPRNFHPPNVYVLDDNPRIISDWLIGPGGSGSERSPRKLLLRAGILRRSEKVFGIRTSMTILAPTGASPNLSHRQISEGRGVNDGSRRHGIQIPRSPETFARSLTRRVRVSETWSNCLFFCRTT